MSKVGYGILAKANLPPFCEGVDFDPAMPTRREEYHFVRDALDTRRLAPILDEDDFWLVDVHTKYPKPLRILDAGSGLTPNQHVMPYILSRMGHYVVALDSDPRSLEMPADANVERVLGDLTNMDVAGPFDAVICVSVLEHLPTTDTWRFAREASRLVRKGGLLVVTADEMNPTLLAGTFALAFDVGEPQPLASEPTQPWVAYLVARRL